MVVGQLARKATLGECPKKVARLIDLVNLPSNLREFADGQSQMSPLSFFIRVWSHIKTHNLQYAISSKVATDIAYRFLSPSHIAMHSLGYLHELLEFLPVNCARVIRVLNFVPFGASSMRLCHLSDIAILVPPRLVELHLHCRSAGSPPNRTRSSHKFLLDPNNKNLVNCDDKLKSILLGKTQVELSELPMLIKHHFPNQSK
ncbi:hypothetical protein ZIOFF_003084 [Zingiber officinale]|uniref:DM2 domain-containing protein n=1 Tax=Zingiber officinale TaxID=94328 RepID=A0A8J5I620_ZINOF|nr:hypothetical protein ZIOFF_003084 [Zingiber officinale]